MNSRTFVFYWRGSSGRYYLQKPTVKAGSPLAAAKKFARLAEAKDTWFIAVEKRRRTIPRIYQVKGYDVIFYGLANVSRQQLEQGVED